MSRKVRLDQIMNSAAIFTEDVARILAEASPDSQAALRMQRISQAIREALDADRAALHSRVILLSTAADLAKHYGLNPQHTARKMRNLGVHPLTYVGRALFARDCLDVPRRTAAGSPEHWTAPTKRDPNGSPGDA